MKVLGETEVSVKYKNQEAKLLLVVVKGRGPSLLGRNWLKVIQLDWRSIKHIPTELESLLYKYDELLKEELSIVGVNAKLSVKQDAIPKFLNSVVPDQYHTHYGRPSKKTFPECNNWE